MHGIVLLLLGPFAAALVLALLRDRPRLERAVSLAAAAAVTAHAYWLLAYVDAHGIQATMLGGHAAPYGVALVADRLACIMVCLSMTVGTVVLAYACFTTTAAQQRTFFLPFFHLLLLGVNWSFLTGDLFNLFVAYEVMLIASYGVLLAGGTRQQVRQSMMYVAVNLVGGALFIVGLGLVYALAGTLNFADLAERTATLTGPRAALLTAASLVLLVVFGLKAAVFPLFSWLPDAYPVLPAGVNGYVAGVLTKVGVYSLLRMFVMVFRQEGHTLAADVLLGLSGFTMLLGVLGALCQWEMRRLLSWHIISQVGYMVMGIGLAADPAVATLAVAATIVYVGHNIVVKSSLFLIADVAEQITGTNQIKRMGGVRTTAPALAGLFLVAALSLAGMPPFSGFVAKLAIVRAGLAGHQFAIIAVAVVTSFFTLMSMMKIWTYVYWGTPRGHDAAASWRGPAAATSALVVATVLLGVAAEPCLRIVDAAARDLVVPAAYVDAVLGPGGGRGTRP